ncbi:MAG: carboxypeptidase regulatory-like domain-containing protein [Bryobacteraceae bacterium]
MTVLAILGLLAASALSAQQPSQQDACRLEGRILHHTTGQPIRKATVTLIGAAGQRQSWAATSGDGGGFLFENIPPGRYQLAAERNGFVRQSYGARAGSPVGTPITLDTGQRMEGLEFKLTPQAVIVGKVVDEEGEPVTGSQIMVLRQGAYQRTGGGRMAPSGGQASNDLGEFRVANLAPGRYIVSATSRGGMFRGRRAIRASSEGPEERQVTTYYPGVTNAASATAIEVAPGQEVPGILIQIRKAQVFHVSGRLSGVGENPSRSFRISLMPRTRFASPFGRGGGFGVVQPDGTFDIQGVQAGSYDLCVFRMIQGRQPMAARVPVVVSGANVEGLLVPVGAPLVLTGTVKMENSEEITGMRGNIMLRPSEGFAMNNASANVQADGTFRMESVGRDKYSLTFFRLPDGTFVRSARMGNLEVLDKGLDLTLVEVAPPIEIVLSTKGGMVDGTVVVDGQPAPGRPVTLIPEPMRPDRPDLFKTANTDQSGAFSFSAIAPGEYTLYAWEENIDDSLFDPDFIKLFSDKGKRVTVRENGQSGAQLTVVKDER